VRRAGVSSFGIGGTNCHLVLEESGESPVEAPSPLLNSWTLPDSSASVSRTLPDSSSNTDTHDENAIARCFKIMLLILILILILIFIFIFIYIYIYIYYNNHSEGGGARGALPAVLALSAKSIWSLRQAVVRLANAAELHGTRCISLFFCCCCYCCCCCCCCCCCGCCGCCSSSVAKVGYAQMCRCLFFFK
jgi:acyl transferase domain-containing protein